MLRFIILFIIAYLSYRYIKRLLAGFSSGPGTKKSRDVKTKDDFQKRYRNKIDDADYEEIE
ncbi:MAG: hypothetical protein AB7T22_08915 [Calditrichaceae bacterium]